MENCPFEKQVSAQIGLLIYISGAATSGTNNSETQRIVQNAIGSKFGHITIIWLIIFLVTRLNTKRDTKPF